MGHCQAPHHGLRLDGESTSHQNMLMAHNTAFALCDSFSLYIVFLVDYYTHQCREDPLPPVVTIRRPVWTHSYLTQLR